MPQQVFRTKTSKSSVVMPEQEEKLLYQKYTRIIKSFLNTIAADVLRVRLYQAARLHRQSVTDYLSMHKKSIVSSLEHLNRLLILVFPPENETPYLHFWSFRLLCIVLRATKCLGLQEDGDVKYLLDIYLKLFDDDSKTISVPSRPIGHGTKAKKTWVSVCSAIQRLVEAVGDTDLIGAVRNYVCNVEMGSKIPGHRGNSRLSKLYQELRELENNPPLDEGVRSRYGVRFSRTLHQTSNTIAHGPRSRSAFSNTTPKHSDDLEEKKQADPKVDILILDETRKTAVPENSSRSENSRQNVSDKESDSKHPAPKGRGRYTAVKENKLSTISTLKTDTEANPYMVRMATKETGLDQRSKQRPIANYKIRKRKGSISSDRRPSFSRRKDDNRPAMYTNSPYLQVFKPIERSRGITSLTKAQEKQSSKRNTSAHNPAERMKAAEPKALKQRPASAGSLSNFMRRPSSDNKRVSNKSRGQTHEKDVKQTCPTVNEDPEDEAKLLENVVMKSPRKRKRKVSVLRRRPESAREHRPNFLTASRPQSAVSVPVAGRHSSGHSPVKSHSTTTLHWNPKTFVSGPMFRSNTSIVSNTRKRSISQKGWKSITNRQMSKRSDARAGIHIPTAVSVYGHEEKQLNRSEKKLPTAEYGPVTQTVRNANDNSKQNMTAETKLTKSSDPLEVKVGPLSKPEGMSDLVVRLPVYIEPDKRTGREVIDDEMCMKKIINEVLVHQQVHTAAKHPRLKDIPFVNRFFTYLRVNAITKTFLRTENCEPHKTWHLPDGTKTKFTFLQAFVFRQIEDTDTAAHYLVLKLLHRISCRHKKVTEVNAEGQHKKDDNSAGKVSFPIKQEGKLHSKTKTKIGESKDKEKAKEQSKEKAKANTQQPLGSNYTNKQQTSQRSRQVSKATKGVRSRSQPRGKSNTTSGTDRRASSMSRIDRKASNMSLKSFTMGEPPCWKCQQKELAMTICVNWSNRHVCRLLNQEGAPYKEEHLVPAVKANGLDIVRSIVHFFKENDTWFPANDRVKSALYLARHHRLTKIVKFLEDEGVKDDRQVSTPSCSPCKMS